MTKREVRLAIKNIDEAIENAAIAINFKKASQNEKYKPYQRDVLDFLSKNRVERVYKNINYFHKASE